MSKTRSTELDTSNLKKKLKEYDYRDLQKEWQQDTQFVSNFKEHKPGKLTHEPGTGNKNKR